MSHPRRTLDASLPLFCAAILLFAGGPRSAARADEEPQRQGSTQASGKSGETERPLILAHYMPWYTAKPFSDRWGWHWTMNRFDPEQSSHGRPELASKFTPRIGPYDSGDPHVLEYHLLLMKLAGIDGVIVDWYGLTDYRDYPVLHRNTTRLLEKCERLKMKFVICYEDQTIPALVEANRLKPEDRVSHAVKEIEWLGEHWFKSPSYVRLDGKPVLLSFGHANLTNEEWAECLSRLESPVAYFSQGYRREGAIGGFGWPSPNRGLAQADQFLTDAANWPHAIPAAYPRFDDIYREAGVGEGYPELPDDAGRTFRSTFEKAVQSPVRIIQLVTWNDWGEGTQIEPSVEFGDRDLRVVQMQRRRQADEGFAFTADDLRLPERLLKRRKTASPDEQKALDEIAVRIAAGDLTEARGRLTASPAEASGKP